MNSVAEDLRRRAVELGTSSSFDAVRELEELLKSHFPMVRRAAASALGKQLDRSSSLAGTLVVPLGSAIENEDHPQNLQYMMKALRKCANELTIIQMDVLRDIVRDPNRPAYVRDAANETLAAAEVAERAREARRKHWCSRCRITLSEDESRRSIDKYGKPYCHHCLEEKMHEDAAFTADVEAAKKLRTIDEVAVQSRGEKRIGDWLSSKGIAYRYDERMIIAGGLRLRPDFYLPEFDIYIEYWGMDTPEYVANMRNKQVLYQREKKKLISLSFRDFDQLEQLLEEKLSRYVTSL